MAPDTTAKPLSPEQLAAYRSTSLGWQSSYLKIVDKKSRLVPLDHNEAQLKVYNAMQLQIEHGLPVMLLIYKARQEGISTFIEACLFEWTNRKENWHACVVSVDDVATSKVFKMFSTFQQEMPIKKRLSTVKDSAKAIAYAAPHRSSMLCQTAGSKILGRGGTTKGIHSTEVTFWANAEKQLLGLLQEVPDEPDTMIVLETTANGTNNTFSKRYWSAVKRLRNLYKMGDGGEKVVDPSVLRGYLPIFLSWQDFPEYSTPLPEGRTEVPNMTDEMKDYVKEGLAMSPPCSLTVEQIYFALLKVTNKCGGNYDLFKQEYPRTAREAEISTGRMVFAPEDLDRLQQSCSPAKRSVEFYEEDVTDQLTGFTTRKVKMRDVNRRDNCWSIWKTVDKNHDYCGFADVAEGILSDPNDPHSDPDRSVAAIMDRKAHDVPATYYGRPDTIEYGDQFLLGCIYYNYAWASPEMNSIGLSVLDTMKRANYPYIYNREAREEEDASVVTRKLGWRTTTLTRKVVIVDLQKVVKEGSLRLYDIRFIDELRTFIWNNQGKPEATKGEHDDCVIALGGMVQMHLRNPVGNSTDFLESEPDKEIKLAIVGAFDNLDEMDDNDDGIDCLFEESD